MRYILILLAASLASIGFAEEAKEAINTIQEYPEPVFQEEIFMNGDWMMKIMAIIAACMVALRGIAEGLTRYVASTENTWDDGISKKLNQAIWFLGTFIGKFGYGTPKENVKKDAQKLSSMGK